MEINSAPVKALEDIDLDQVSGGSTDPIELTNVSLSAYSQFSQLATSVLAPWVDTIKESAFKIQYGPTLKVLETYNTNTEYTLSEKAAYYAQSWNAKHPKLEPMSENLAEYILSIQNTGAQVAIACLPTVTDMENAYMALVNSGS